MKNKTRILALQILDKCELSGAHASELLRKQADTKDINYPLLQKLVKGTLQWRHPINASLDQVFGQDAAKIMGSLRNVLRLACYQFLYFNKVSRSLVLEETLEIASGLRSPIELSSLKKSLLRLRPKKASSKKISSSKNLSAEEIALSESHPLWVVERLIKQYGAKETLAFCQANNRPWPTCIRTNIIKLNPKQLSARLASEGVEAVQCHYNKECFKITALPKGMRLHLLPSFRRGLFQVQDESSSLVSHLVGAKPGEFIVDLCAAPGGKATHLAMLMGNSGRILAVDIHGAKLPLLKRSSLRFGVKIITTMEADATKLTLPNLADRVLVDAPCSGLGVLGRKGDLRWNREETSLAELCELQYKLLERAAALVRPGGRIVYSTCSVDCDENENVIYRFLRQHPECKILPPP